VICRKAAEKDKTPGPLPEDGYHPEAFQKPVYESGVAKGRVDFPGRQRVALLRGGN